MFTGIIQQLGSVVEVKPNDFGVALRIDPQNWSHRPSIGDSIAVNGCCLTIAPDTNDSHGVANVLRFDVVRQTLDATALADLRSGDSVNLEHAATPQTMLGGHLVQGHIDAIGLVGDVQCDTTEWRVRIEPPDHALDCIIEKGSIAVNGVSLTVAAIHETWFEVALIPTTLRLTNLSNLKRSCRVNLETDYIAKIVVNWMRRNQR